jgi:hypothetical protein
MIRCFDAQNPIPSSLGTKGYDKPKKSDFFDTDTGLSVVSVISLRGFPETFDYVSPTPLPKLHTTE